MMVNYNDNLEVLISSGGTISWIDDVRYVGNLSSGNTGAAIAESFLEKGFNVHYVFGYNAAIPFKKHLQVNPDKDLGDELKKVLINQEKFHRYKDRLRLYSGETFDEYVQSVKDILTMNPLIDFTILAAAVSDYSAIKTNGKISSNLEELNILLKKNEKVISKIKQWNPETNLIGFKLLSDVSEEELIRVAKEQGSKYGELAVVANLVNNGDVENSKTFIVPPYAEPYLIDRKELPNELVNIVEEIFV